MSNISEVVPPKWALETKRGWGMVITFVTTVLPIVNTWVSAKWGIQLDAPFVMAFGEAVTSMIDSVGLVVGLALWFVGSMRPTAPLTLLRK
jgi:hypothetical protein